MKWNELNANPSALLWNGSVVPLYATGTGDGFLWAWDGTEDKLQVWQGAELSTDGHLTSRGGNDDIGWVSPMTDMPEIDNIGEAVAAWHRARGIFDSPDFQAWLSAEVTTYGK